jgi:hypothetical protein
MATVVSAYYPIPSKSSAETYLKWIEEFWPKIPCRLVFFTCPKILPLIEKMFADRPGPTRIVGIPFMDFAAFNKLPPTLWIDAKKLDTENVGHSPELYATWYEKKEFVQRAIALNPFGSDKYVWCDAGICRYPAWIPYLMPFPKAEIVPAGRMLVLRIEPFDHFQSAEADGIYGEFTGKNSVGGGILASDIAGWTAWSIAYDAMLIRYHFAGRFIGKDQNIMGSMILERPELAILLDPPPIMSGVERWFYLLFCLAGVRVE